LLNSPVYPAEGNVRLAPESVECLHRFHVGDRNGVELAYNDGG